MPLRHPVERLTTLSLGAVKVLVKVRIDAISAKSFEALQWYLRETDLADTRARAAVNENLDEAVDCLRTSIFSSVAWYCYPMVMDTILDVLSELWTFVRTLSRKEAGAQVAHRIATVVRYSRVVSHPNATVLNLGKVPRAMKSEILRSLGRMTGLERLDFGSGGGGYGRSLWMQLRHLSRLKRVILQNDCENETLAVLGQNCLDLEYLDISGSQEVTDGGVTWLVHLQDLKYCDLHQTCVSVEAYAHLLLGLKHIRTVGRCDKFGQVLEYIWRHQGGQLSRKLPVKVCHSRDMSREQLQLLATMCPHLTHVSLYVDEDMGDLLTPLTELKELQELKLLACNFYADKIDVLLRQSGHQLTMLHLEHIDELDMNALSCIAETCANLQKLVFFSCDFVENFGPPSSSRPFVTPPFRKLDTLVCISESAPNVIEFLLVNACWLKRVQFGSTAWFNDVTVANVLSKGALKNIEEIRILKSYELTMESVDLLIGSCPKLCVLSEMDGWEGIDASELADLRAKIKSQNMALDTFAQWNIITG